MPFVHGSFGHDMKNCMLKYTGNSKITVYTLFSANRLADIL